MTQYEVTVTEETYRPLADIPMGVVVVAGNAPELQIESCSGFSENDLAVEYVARFFGNVSMTVFSDGAVIYGSI